MKPVLVDTSAWVDFLRPGARPLGERVDELIESDRARLCGVVVVELLHGVQSAKEQRQMNYLLENVGRVPTLEDDWDTAGIAMQRLRKKGITLPLTDVLIAVVANRNNVGVLTADGHFQHLGVELV